MAPLGDVLSRLLDASTRLPWLRRPVFQAAGWVLSDDVPLPLLPPAPVAAIDGLAVSAFDTQGASDYAPIPLSGNPILAGEPLPPGTDAVLRSDSFDEGPVALISAAPGCFVVPAGHDVPAGTLLPAGTVLRPLHLGLMARGGYTMVPVVRRPRVVLRATDRHRIDGLAALITALIEAEGGLVADDPVEIDGAPPPDLILLVAYSRAIVCEIPHEFGILHTPAEAGPFPAPCLTLPGAPLRSLILFSLLVAPAIRRMGGRPEPIPLLATLARKVTSALGQLDAVPVRLEAGIATPLGDADGCSLLAATTANGLLLVPENSEGYPAGATISVRPLP